MAPTKLTEAEKETIFRLYRETDETTSTLSRQYGVSVSTISRLLKSKLPLEEYEELVRSKRSGLNRNSEDSLLDTLADTEDSGGDEALGDDSGENACLDEEHTDLLEQTKVEANVAVNEAADTSPSAFSLSGDRLGGDRRRRRRTSVAHNTDIAQNTEAVDNAADFQQDQDIESKGLDSQQLDLLSINSDAFAEEDSAAFRRPILRKAAEPEVRVEPSVEEEDDDEDDEDSVYSFGDEEFGDDEDDFDDEDEGEEESLGLTPLFGQKIEILSLSEAHLPRVCYLVVDRTGELVTCRLQDFRELGQIPETEAHHRTLPLFDNHRIARRFSRRNQRVIKLPDGKMLQKTARWLEAKGITRLLLDGKVYDLES